MKSIDRLFTAISGAALFVMMMLIVTDVTLRYLANAPVFFAHDLVVLYLTPIVFFMGFGPTLYRDEHLAVDVVSRKLPKPLRTLSRVLGALIGLSVFVPLLWVSFERAWASLLRDEVIASIVPWPAWASYAIVPIGTIAMVVACFVRIFGVSRPAHEIEDTL